MKPERILLIGGVSLVKRNVRDAGPVMVEICDEIDPLLKEIDFVENAPFDTINLIIRFGENQTRTRDRSNKLSIF